jgi:hypothetical protein
MTDCETLLDLMPVVAAGRAIWPAGAEEHLRTCSDCRSAWQVVGAAARLGGNAPATIDYTAMAARVSGRVGAARRAERTRRTFGLLSLLAAAAITLIVWRGHPGAVTGTTGSVQLTPEARAFVIPVSGLDELDTGQLQAIYQQLDGPLGAGGSVGGPALEELSPDEMSQVLSTYQG